MMPGKITAVREIPIDLKEDFLSFAGRFAHRPGTVLLMSGGDLDCSRYHILAIKPWMTIKGRGQKLWVQTDNGEAIIPGDPFEVLQTFLDYFRMEPAFPGTPLAAGLLGYLAYDLKDAIEDLPRSAIDDLCLPHLHLIAPSLLVIHDKSNRHTRLFAPERCGTNHARVEEDLAWFNEKTGAPRARKNVFKGSIDGFTSNFSRPAYMDAIHQIRSYIASGHVYQVNMSQRFETDFFGDPFALFERLYQINPAPFFAFINAGDHHIVSTSPERFIRQDGRAVETRPIKGTRPRGKTPEEDGRLARELQDSPKDDAELSMIVDLLRNDIGKVCSAGSVRVIEHKRIEPYQNVYHLVSTIEGNLDPDKDSVDLIKATFPGGSITGCPKIRSMEIIDELEPNRRHIYTGSIGYISFHDTMDLSIAIRTATIHNGRIIFSVGGGVVYDSDPSDEFEETLHKGESLLSVFRGDGFEGTTPEAWAWANGRVVPLQQATVPAAHPGAQFGHGFFETIRADNGAPQHLQEHIDRFNKAWSRLFPGDAPDLSWDVIIRQVLDKNRLCDETAAVKILAFMGSREIAPFDHTLVVTAKRYVHRLTGRTPAGIHLITYPHPRENPLADYKTLNYLYYLRAGRWAKDRGGDEALIINADHSLSETNTANIVPIRGCHVWLPRSAHALPGIMSRAVISFLTQEGYASSTSTIYPQDLFTMDMVLITNSLMGPVPALTLDGKDLQTDWDLFEKIRRTIS